MQPHALLLALQAEAKEAGDRETGEERVSNSQLAFILKVSVR